VGPGAEEESLAEVVMVVLVLHSVNVEVGI